MTMTYDLTINFYDACLDAAINSQIITFPTQVFQDYTLSATQISVPAFTDSVDSAGFPTGSCGEKRITLDGGTPSFLTIVSGADPVLDPFAIVFDTASPVITDCQVYTVSYTVEFVDYASSTSITETFSFELVDVCASATINS